MADCFQAAIDTWRVMSDPCLPPGYSTERRANDDIVSGILGIFGDNNVINCIFDDLRQEVFESCELCRETAVKSAAVRVLAFPSFDHDMGFFAVVPLHDAGNLIAVSEAAATDSAGRFLPITHNEKRPFPRCKQGRNLLR